MLNDKLVIRPLMSGIDEDGERYFFASSQHERNLSFDPYEDERRVVGTAVFPSGTVVGEERDEESFKKRVELRAVDVGWFDPPLSGGD